jgi:MOSC domain-containing protein YiiM
LPASVFAVHSSDGYTMTKPTRVSIVVVAGLGVENDVHSGATVKHRSRMKANPDQPNLRQVHLIHNELFDELRDKGFEVHPGMMGENITTSSIDLLGQPTGTLLHIGDDVVLEITGLRNPCAQLDGLIPGLMSATLDRDDDGELVRKAGVMTVVIEGGVVRPNDEIRIELPAGERLPLEPV